jgi:hypothetical protein
MRQLGSYPVAKIRMLQDRLRQGLIGAKALEQAAQLLASLVATEFVESVVLARVYATLRFESLPHENRQFARNAGNTAPLDPGVPVLSLMGTYGDSADWRDRRSSRGHVGFPLLSRDFVSSRPMMASLLSGLGLMPQSFDRRLARARSDAQPIAASSVFHVFDAQTARDTEGRHIISSQPFVSAYSVKTVFGLGGTWPNGSLVACVVFTREALPRANVRRFAPMLGVFRACTTSLVMNERFFLEAKQVRDPVAGVGVRAPT